MKASDVIAAARIELKDNIESYRWPDTIMLPFVSDGQLEITGNRPDSMYETAIVTTQPGPLSDVTDDLVISNYFKLALVFFVCARCLQMDNENAANINAAANYLGQYAALLK